MQWILDHADTIGALVALAIAILKAWRKGELLKTVILGVEEFGFKSVKEVIQEIAEKRGVQKALDAIVQKYTEPVDRDGI